MSDLLRERTSSVTYVCLAAVGCSAVYLYWALVALSLEGIDNISGTGQGETVAFLVVLMAMPPVVWGVGYWVVQGHFSRRVCSVLYATALVLPLTFIGLVVRVAMGGGF